MQVGPRPALSCRALASTAQHLFTSKRWQLGVERNGSDAGWTEVVHAIGSPLVRVRQVHGADVAVRRGGGKASQGTAADIIVSNDATTAIAVQTADCVPILIADRRNSAVAAVHAGWRGLMLGVPRVAVEALAREFGSRPADLMAAIGPSIDACCYEVGSQVRQGFEQAGWPESAVAGWFSSRPQPTGLNRSLDSLPAIGRSGYWYFSTAAAARDQLHMAGVPLGQIFVADLCTASHPEHLCSFRRDGSEAGRTVAVIRPRGARRQEVSSTAIVDKTSR